MTGVDKWTLRILAAATVGLLVLQITERLQAREIGGFVEPRCSATQGGVSCTFTNMSGEASRSCVFGEVTNKADRSKMILSQQLCTGRLEGFETRTVNAEWLVGTPDQICSTSGQFGDHLDWSQCDFKVQH